MIKTVSIVGCGALGIMYASHIQKTCPVQFVADRERVDRYRTAQFYANGERQHFEFASDTGAQPSDLVIFTVKFNHLGDAVRIASQYIGGNTIVLSFLNGISSEDIIGETHDPVKIIPSMVAGMDATKTGYSVDYSQMGYVAFGGLARNDPRDIESLAEFFGRVGIKYEIKKDITKAIWWKYVLNIGVNQCSALLRSSYGIFQTPGYAENMLRMTMDEAYAVARRLGVGLTDGDIDECVRIIKTLSPDGKTSMLQDIEARRPTEVDMFAGTLVELGKGLGIPTPVNEFLFNAIKATESGWRH